MEITDYWGSDPKYPVRDWQYEVGNGDTRMGYWEWVDDKREQAEIDNEMMHATDASDTE